MSQIYEKYMQGIWQRSIITNQASPQIMDVGVIQTNDN